MTDLTATARHAMGTAVDPLLECQLALAADDDLVEAILLLKGDDAGDFPTSTARLVARVCEQAPVGAVETNYLPQLGILIVRARPSIIHKLIAQPEIECASANREREAACSNASC